MITFAFPPNAEAGARRLARLCHYLPEHGIDPIVLTARGDCYQLRDDSLLPPAVEIHRTGVRKTLVAAYSGFARRGAAATTPISVPAETAAAHRAAVWRRAFGLRKRLLRALETPDAHRNWRAPAIHAGAKLLRAQRFDAILSSGPPWTSHVIARNLHRRFRVPWVADFRDPWAPAAGRDPRWRKAVQAHMEAACVRDADLVVCNTQALRDNFAQRYPALAGDKFVTVTNGFDDSGPDAAPAPQPPPGAPRILLHLGSIYGERRIDSFCQALEQLVHSGALPPGSVSVLLVGHADPGLPEIARASAPEATLLGMVEVRPVQPWHVARELLRDAGLLLLFQGSYRLQVPAKFYEYLQTGKPMLAVAERGALTDLLEATSAGVWADPADPEAIATALTRALALPARSPADVERLWSGQYHFRALAGKLAGHIRALAPAGPAGTRRGEE